MPFVRVYLEGEPGFTTGKLIAPIPTKPNQVPIFLIPGILGNATEYSELTEKIRELGDDRDIFVWYDPLLAPDKKRPYKENASLLEQSKLIAQCILEDCMQSGPTPYLLVGYSYGCSLAALAAEQLQLANPNNDPKLYLIDGPSPECAKRYFSQHSSSLTTDLINIVKYAASLSVTSHEFNEQDIIIPPVFLQSLETKSPLDCIDEAANLIQKSYEEIDIAFFEKNIKIAKQGIYNLINAPDDLPATKIHKIVTFITQQTAEKYGDEYGGWRKHAQKLSIVDDPLLKSKDHRVLLKQSTGKNNNDISGYSRIEMFTGEQLLPSFESGVLYLQKMNDDEIKVFSVENGSKTLSGDEASALEKMTEPALLFKQSAVTTINSNPVLFEKIITACGYNHIDALAQSIEEFISRELSAKNMLTKHMNFLIEAFCVMGAEEVIQGEMLARLQETASRMNGKIDSPITEHRPGMMLLTQNSPILSPDDSSYPKIRSAIPLNDSPTQIEFFSDNDSSDEESDKDYNKGKVKPDVFIKTLDAVISQRLRFFSPQVCSTEVAADQTEQLSNLQKVTYSK